MKITPFLIVLMFLGLYGHEAKAQWAIRGGYTYQYNSFAEVGIGFITKKIKPSHDFVTLKFPEKLNSVFVSTEFNFQRDFLLGSKVGYEMAWVRWAPVTSRLNYAYYTDFTQVDMRIVPEVGVNLFGYIHLTYGYNIPLQTFEFEGIRRSRISLIITKDFGK